MKWCLEAGSSDSIEIATKKVVATGTAGRSDFHEKLRFLNARWLRVCGLSETLVNNRRVYW